MNKSNKVKRLVAVKAPKAKTPWLKTLGYNQREIFGFPTKRTATDFIVDVSQFGVECLIAKA